MIRSLGQPYLGCDVIIFQKLFEVRGASHAIQRASNLIHDLPETLLVLGTQELHLMEDQLYHIFDLVLVLPTIMDDEDEKKMQLRHKLKWFAAAFLTVRENRPAVVRHCRIWKMALASSVASAEDPSTKTSQKMSRMLENRMLLSSICFGEEERKQLSC